jgi:hypothetical protein
MAIKPLRGLVKVVLDEIFFNSIIKSYVLTYLTFVMSSLQSFNHFKIKDGKIKSMEGSALEVTSSIGMNLINISAPFIASFVIIKNFKKIKNTPKNMFRIRVLFEEFKRYSMIGLHYFPFFLLRRLILAVLIIFLDDLHFF